MGLWDDKCKKCFYNSWECKCKEVVEVAIVKDTLPPATMEQVKEQVTNDVKEQEIEVMKKEIEKKIELPNSICFNSMNDDIILLNGKCEDKLKEIPDNSIDLITTDPPYGYSFMGKDWDKAVPSVEVWKECLRVLKPGGFAFIMSAPRQDVLARMMMNLEAAGFETAFTSMYWAYATGFPKGTNMSKAIDKKLGVEREIVGVKYDAKDFSDPQFVEQGSMMQTHTKAPRTDIYETKSKTELGKRVEGLYAGMQPKPAVEVIIVCMKPLSEKNYLEQTLKRLNEEKNILEEIKKQVKIQEGVDIEWE